MSLVLSLAGAWLVALFVVALAADVTNWWHCARCGEPVDSVLHFSCVDGRCASPAIHHRYAKPSWPYVVLSVLMAIDALAIVAVR